MKTKRFLALFLCLTMLLSLLPTVASAEGNPDYYLVGSFNMSGNDWVVGDQNYKLTKTSEGVYSITTVLPAYCKFKIWDTEGNWYGVEGNDCIHDFTSDDSAGLYNELTVQFNTEGNSISVTPLSPGYYLVGGDENDANVLNNWAVKSAYKLTNIRDDLYYIDVDTGSGTNAEYKIIKVSNGQMSNSSWEWSGANATLSAGEQRVYFKASGGVTNWVGQKVKAVLAESVANDGYYLAGSMNSWTADAAYRFVDENENGTLTLRVSLDSAAEAKVVYVVDGQIILYESGGNRPISAGGHKFEYYFSMGTYHFNDLTAYSVTVANNITNGTVTVNKGLAINGEQVTVTVAPDEGYQLNALSVTYGGGVPVETSGTGKTYTFLMGTNAITVTATFTETAPTPTEYTITVSDGITGGTVTVDNASSVTYTAAGQHTIIANPSEGYEFVSITDGTHTWTTENGGCTYEDGHYVVNWTIGANELQNYTVTATFEQTPVDLYVWVNHGKAAGEAGKGSVSVKIGDANPDVYETTNGAFVGHDYHLLAPGTAIEVTVSAGEHSSLSPSSGISGIATEDITISGNTYSFTMPDCASAADGVQISLLFELYFQYTFTVGTHTNGTLTVNNETSATVYEDESITIKATPNAGYKLTNVKIAAVGQADVTLAPAAATEYNSETNTYTFVVSNPTNNATVTATFTAIPYTVAVGDPIANGTVAIASGVTNGTATVGGTVTLSATPDAGYQLKAYTVTPAVGEAFTVTDNTFTMPAANVTITAEFVVVDGYYLVGGEGINGTLTWTPIPDNRLTGENGVYSLEKTIAYDSSNDDNYYKFKIRQVENGVPTYWYSGDGENDMVLSNVTDSETRTHKFTIDTTDGNKVSEQILRTVTVGTGLTGGSITGVSPATAYQGDTITVNLNPDTDYVVGSVLVNGSATDVTLNGNTATFDMPNADVTVTATFVPQPKNVMLFINPNSLAGLGINGTGSVTVTAGGVEVALVNDGHNDYYSIQPGAQVVVTATAGEGCVVSYLQVGDERGKTYTSPFEMPALDGLSINVSFKKINSEITVEQPGTGSTVAVAGGLTSADYGTEITLTNNPATGYQLKAYVVTKTGDAETTVTVTDGQFTMPAYGVTVTAEFEKIPYDITISGGITGGTVSAAATAHAGDEVTLTIAPTLGFALDSLTVTKTGDAETKVTVTDGKFTMPAYGVTVTATFTQVLQDGYYLIGEMTDPKWTITASTAYKMTRDETTGLYYIDTTFTNGTEFKAAYYEAGELTLYPGDDKPTYYVTADGAVRVLLNPNGTTESGWHQGYLFVENTYEFARENDNNWTRRSMEYVAGAGLYVYTASLAAGEHYGIEATYNYATTQVQKTWYKNADGSNFSVETAGTYVISINRWTKEVKATLVPETTPTLEAAYLSLEGNIGVNFRIVLPTGVGADTVTAEFYLGNATSPAKTVLLSTLEPIEGKYVVGYSLPARLVNQSITIKVKVGEEYKLQGTTGSNLSGGYATSIVACCDAYISGPYDEKVKTLAQALLNYGGYADWYLNEGTTELPNYATAVTMTENPFSDIKIKSKPLPNGLVLKSVFLSLQSETELNLIFTVTGNHTVDEYEFYFGETKLTPTIEDSTITVKVRGIAAKNLAVQQTVTVKKGASSYEVRVSALYYGKLVLRTWERKKTNDSASTMTLDQLTLLSNLMKAMKLYNDAAIAYFA